MRLRTLAPARRQRRLALSSTWGPSQKRWKKGRAFFPRSYFRPVAILAHGYFRPAAMSARARRSATRAGSRRRTLCCALCPLMLYPFRLTAPPTVLGIAQAAEAFVPEKFVISSKKRCCKKHCPKVGSAFCLCAAQCPRQNTLVYKLPWRLREQTSAALT